MSVYYIYWTIVGVIFAVIGIILIFEIRNLIKEIRNIKDKWLWKIIKMM